MFEKIRFDALNRNIPIVKLEAEYILVEKLKKYRPKNVVEIGTAIGTHH